MGFTFPRLCSGGSIIPAGQRCACQVAGEGRMLRVRYGPHNKPAQASDDDATNEFVARNVVEGWIATELADCE